MEATYITSRTNPLVISFAKLAEKKERDKTGLYIAEGYKLCTEACGRVSVAYAVLRQDREQDAAYAELARRSGGTCIILSEPAYDKITKDHSPDGILFVIQMESRKIPADLMGERICILDGLQDPGNVGTIIRTAAALGFDRIYLHECADIYNPKVIRATMGAFFKIFVSPCDTLEKTISCLQQAGRRVLAAALSDTGITLGKDALFSADCLILGNEGHGVSDIALRLCDTTIKIPMTEKTESLNAAAAAAVLLWEYSKLPAMRLTNWEDAAR